MFQFQGFAKTYKGVSLLGTGLLLLAVLATALSNWLFGNVFPDVSFVTTALLVVGGGVVSVRGAEKGSWSLCMIGVMVAMAGVVTMPSDGSRAVAVLQVILPPGFLWASVHDATASKTFLRYHSYKPLARSSLLTGVFLSLPFLAVALYGASRPDNVLGQVIWLVVAGIASFIFIPALPKAKVNDDKPLYA